MMIALLEDDERRAEAMLRAAATLDGVKVVHFDNAPDMVAWLPENLPTVALLALDHDLGPSRLRDGEQFDPGIGRDVADALLSLEPTCPVLIHSTNATGAQGMQFALEAAGWTVERVIPFDDLVWIERAWLPEARRLLGLG